MSNFSDLESKVNENLKQGTDVHNLILLEWQHKQGLFRGLVNQVFLDVGRNLYGNYFFNLLPRYGIKQKSNSFYRVNHQKTYNWNDEFYQEDDPYFIYREQHKHNQHYRLYNQPTQEELEQIELTSGPRIYYSGSDMWELHGGKPPIYRSQVIQLELRVDLKPKKSRSRIKVSFGEYRYWERWEGRGRFSYKSSGYTYKIAWNTTVESSLEKVIEAVREGIVVTNDPNFNYNSRLV